jgi:hypothetical protein
MDVMVVFPACGLLTGSDLATNRKAANLEVHATAVASHHFA